MPASRYYPTMRPLYFPASGPPQGDWDTVSSTRENRGEHWWTFLAAPTKVGGGKTTNGFGTFTSVTVPTTAAIITEDVWTSFRWVTPPLAAQTLSGTFNLCLAAVSTFGQINCNWKVHAYITVGDSLDVRTVIVNNHIDAGTAFGSLGSVQFETLVAPPTIAGAVQAGDRIVIEVGARCDNVTALVTSYSVYYGTTDGSNVPLADGVAGYANVDRAGWFEFSDGLTETGVVPAAPANSTCAASTLIASLPFTSGEIPSTESAGTNKDLWFEWTAPFSGRVLLSCLGSNYATRILIWKGTCAGLVAHNFWWGTEGQLWLGTGQSLKYFEAVSGTIYHFQVQDQHRTDATSYSKFQALNCGGALVFGVTAYDAIATDDLLVNCQWLTRWRDGELKDTTDALYASTPVGSAIDYSRTPIYDNQSGGTNTNERLVVGIFGQSTLLEVGNVDPLEDFGDYEINFYFFTFLTGLAASRSQFENSLVFNQAAEIYVGYLGSAGESVIGALSTPDGCKVRRISNTWESASGAGHPGADAFAVDQDVGGSWFVEIASDQTILWYTSAGTEIKRIDVSTSLQLGDFATVPNAPGPRPGLRSIRLLPPGDGSTGLIAANGSQVVRLDGAGTVIQTYTPPNPQQAQDLDKLEFTHLADKFWVSDQFSTHLYQFDLASGALLQDIATGLPPGQLCGFSIYNGYRAGVSTPPEPPVVTGPPGCPDGLPFSPGSATPGCVPVL